MWSVMGVDGVEYWVVCRMSEHLNRPIATTDVGRPTTADDDATTTTRVSRRRCVKGIACDIYITRVRAG